MTYTDILRKMKSYYSPRNIAGMARYGINVKKAYGVPTPVLWSMAKQIRGDHGLAERLWATGIHDAKILAAFADDPTQVTEAQMERWARDFDTWDVVDQCCNRLFRQTSCARRKAVEWTRREEEYVKRAGFVLIACLAAHDKTAKDGVFIRYLGLIKKGATDERNFVKKAVNWALRQIGKRNMVLRQKAMQDAAEIQTMESRSARWIAADALRELKDPKTVARIRARMHRP
ncbi:MAG: DNA alkylation repair protein [Acidobacteria bacterium]|nr:DNA alkylation repair protein [Acidobacteriota bacterium]